MSIMKIPPVWGSALFAIVAASGIAHAQGQYSKAELAAGVRSYLEVYALDPHFWAGLDPAVGRAFEKAPDKMKERAKAIVGMLVDALDALPGAPYPAAFVAKVQKDALVCLRAEQDTFLWSDAAFQQRRNQFLGPVKGAMAQPMLEQARCEALRKSWNELQRIARSEMCAQLSARPVVLVADLIPKEIDALATKASVPLSQLGFGRWAVARVLPQEGRRTHNHGLYASGGYVQGRDG